MVSTITFLMLLQGKPPKLAPAVFADASTRRIVELSRKAYSKLKSAKLSIVSGGETKQYAFSNGKLAGSQKGAKWAWGQKQLVLQCGKGLYQGRMGPYNINAWLGKVGANPEVIPIQLVAKKNPVDVLVAPGSRVRKVGTLVLNGAAVDVVEVKSPLLRVNMAIRQDNRLIADLSATNVDKDGKTLFNSSRTFKWSSVNKPISSGEFGVGAGKVPKPIRSLN